LVKGIDPAQRIPESNLCLFSCGTGATEKSGPEVVGSNPTGPTINHFPGAFVKGLGNCSRSFARII